MSAQPTLPTICKTNHLPLEEFTSVISLLFEPTALLTQRIHDACPYESYDQLLDKAGELIKELSPLEQLEVVNAHPRIGESAAKLSALSKIEQGNASANEDAVLAKWAELNRAYEDKYGFRFVIFVNGRSKESLFPIVEDRIANSSKNQELATGLSEMVDIARDRARKLLAANPASGAPSPKI
ncbi:hypothetical protein GGH12_002980 [Coemansia sp. RSA 1822]|nr:hypothetical protein LPJ76_001382 [Coemansia sp. RSA 638]KAJ2121392.1 hypothetical protein IW147_004279 [Coemansia sp. RSA 720]KAJ2474834.1 hypothetical protein IWW56_005697 [Coemansia sp. RSA 2131]KAJ2543808.1 hypothetical protein GGF49_001767 [Coemansia sp. RSA 1853]KAJ2562822.1 hypothetical protein GGH12_002980 [Coemansia sp. RSA 1822]KAJ2660367.1 hypothetical protein IW148_003842 [Coemansia sp. RSA 1199]